MKIYSISSFISRRNNIGQGYNTRQKAVQNFGESMPVQVSKLAIPQDELAVYQQKTREELVRELMWVKDVKTREVTGNYQGEEGNGYKSIVAVAQPQDKYSKDELAKLAWFSEKATEQCLQLFGFIEFTPIHVFDKNPSGTWCYMRETEDGSTKKFDTLDDAIISIRFLLKK